MNSSNSDALLLLSDAEIVAARPPRNAVDPARPYAFLVEPERTADGAVEDFATIFLTNRECPFRCLMCDLWKNTLEQSVEPGQIPEQIRWALAQLPPARHLKLYNAASFFDPRAIPESDYPEIVRLAAPFERVIVECHPKVIGRRCRDFHARLGGTALMEANRTLARASAEKLAARFGTRLANPAALEGAMSLVELPFGGAATMERQDNVRHMFYELGCDIPIMTLADTFWLRLSAQAYNLPSDFDRLGDLVEMLSQRTA